MADIEGQVGLDLSEALAGIDRIDEALGSAVQNFKVGLAEALDLLSSVSVGEVDASNVTSGIDAAVAAADLEPVIDADASGVTTDIDAAVDAAGAEVTPEVAAEGITEEIDAAISSADAQAPVSADTTGMEADIEAVGANVPPVEIPVDADTSDAEAAIESLGDTATTTAGDLGEAGGAAGGAAAGFDLLGPAAGFAAGNVGELGTATGALPPQAKAAAGGVLALVAAGAELFDNALKQQTALERLGRTFGETAADVQRVDVGGLNEDISELALRTGGADEGLQNFAASMGLAGQSAGKGNTEIAGTVDQMIALATRASVLNPELGSSDEIIGRLSTGLARGGRFLQAFGISLTAAEINARALSDTGKQSAADLSLYEKSAAGAAIATERLGNNLGKDINEGAKSDAVQMRSFRTALDETVEAAGADIVGPIVDDMRELLPVAQQAATLLGVTLKTAIDALGPSIRLAGEFFKETADLMGPLTDDSLGLAEGLGQAINPAAGLFDLFSSGKEETDGLKTSLDSVGEGFADVRTGVDTTATAMAEAVSKASGLGEAMGHVGVTTQDLVAAASRGKAGVQDLSNSLDASGASTGKYADEAHRVIDATQVLADAFQRNAREALNHLVVTGQLNDEQVKGLESTTKLASGNTDYLGVLRQLAPQAAAQAQAQAAANAAAATGVGTTTDLAAAAEAGAAAQAKLATETANTANKMLDNLVKTGALTSAQRDQAVAVHTSKDGSVDYLAVLKEIDPKLADQAERQGRVNAGLADTRTRFEVAADAADLYKTRLDELLGRMVGASEAEIRFRDSVDEAGKKLLENKGAIDLHTEAGRNDATAINTVVTNIGNHIDALIREGGTQEQVTRARNEGIAALQVLERQYPQLKPVIDPYIVAIQSIPPDRGTFVHADNVGPSIVAAHDVKFSVDSIPGSHNTVITADASQARGEINGVSVVYTSVKAALERAPIRIGADIIVDTPPGFSADIRRQAGGPFDPFQVFTANEAGQEAFVFSRGGFVVNHQEAVAAVERGAASGGGISESQLRAVLEEVVARARPITVNEVAGDPEATAFAVAARLGAAATR